MLPTEGTGDGAARAADTVFRPVRPVNAFEETVERLLQAIHLGVVAPGERLPAERELSARLAVSRVTLREAIRALTQAGFLESRRGRYGGTFVTTSLPEPPAPPDRAVLSARLADGGLDDVLVLRTVLESGAAAAAAARPLSAQDRSWLRAHLEETRAAGPADYRRMDSRFHLAVAELARSPALTAAVAEQRMRVNELLDAIPLLERNIAHADEQHERVAEAICAGDPDRARLAMAEHLEGTALLLRGFLSPHPASTPLGGEPARKHPASPAHAPSMRERSGRRSR